MAEQIGKRISVLDKGWVELQDVMGDDLAIVNAARTSFLGESKGGEKDKKLLFYLMQHRHDGPFEMATLKYRIKAPEVVWRQLLRHRSGNFNLQSYRYMEAQEEEFYAPTVWRQQAKSNKQASEGELDAENAAMLCERLQEHYSKAYQLYKDAIEMGVAREQARLFLPGFALYSIGIVQFDLRNLLHFLSLRKASEAQFEIRQFADAMGTFVEELFPWTWEAYTTLRLESY